MSVAARLVAFVLVLGVVFAAAAAVGRAIDRVHDDEVGFARFDLVAEDDVELSFSVGRSAAPVTMELPR